MTEKERHCSVLTAATPWCDAVVRGDGVIQWCDGAMVLCDEVMARCGEAMVRCGGVTKRCNAPPHRVTKFCAKTAIKVFQ